MKDDRRVGVQRLNKIKKHTVLLIVLAVATLGTATGLIWYAISTNTEIERRAQQSRVQSAEFDDKIREAKQRAQQKEEARKQSARDIAMRAAKGDASAEGIDAKLCAATHTHINPNTLDVIVNKKHCIQPLQYEPTDLVTSNGATLRAEASEAFAKMLSAAQQAGQGFTVTSSYRSYADQVATYGYWVSVSGQEAADTYSARPGYSEHQTGLAVDVAAPGCMLDCFGATSQYQWLQQNAASYGYIQRYYKGSEPITGYKAEEWHYRYVGVKIAHDMKKRSIVTLEELFTVPGGNY